MWSRYIYRRHRRTDRQTDGQTTYCDITALCVASRGKQEAQLPQRNSASAEQCTCLPRLANWSCNAQNTAESQRLYYFLTFKRSDSRSAGWKRIFAKIAVVDNPNVVWRPGQDEPPRISAPTLGLYFRKPQSLAYILAADSTDHLHSNLCSALQETHLFCNTVLAENGFWRQIATQGATQRVQTVGTLT